MKKKVAFVTGADRGLGFYITQWLLEEEYIVFAGRYLPSWKALDQLKEQFPHLAILPLDIGNVESVREAARIVATQTSHIDLIVNNAGIASKADHVTILDHLNYEDMARIYNVNTLGALRVSHALFPLLLNSDDKLIVNISSEAGSVADNQRITMYGYCMSKAALNMQSSIIHQHLRTLGGQVMVFHPGWLQTYMRGELNEDAPISPKDSADKIMNLVQQHKTFMGEQPAYLDLDGRRLPW